MSPLATLSTVPWVASRYFSRFGCAKTNHVNRQSTTNTNNREWSCHKPQQGESPRQFECSQSKKKGSKIHNAYMTIVTWHSFNGNNIQTLMDNGVSIRIYSSSDYFERCWLCVGLGIAGLNELWASIWKKEVQPIEWHAAISYWLEIVVADFEEALTYCILEWNLKYW